MITQHRRAAPARAPRRSISPTSPPGFYDGFWEVGLNPWDVAAGSLLVQEAGGLIGDLSGKATTCTAAR